MKTELRLSPHLTEPDQTVIELWFDGQLIGSVVGLDGTGVRVLSKYPLAIGAGKMTGAVVDAVVEIILVSGSLGGQTIG